MINVGKYSLHGAFGMLRKNPFLPSLKATAKAPENTGGYKERIVFQPSILQVRLLFVSRRMIW